MSDPKSRLRDTLPYNDSFNAMEVATADRRFEQLLERRERIIERSRFGVLALNGASAVAILSNLQEVRAAASNGSLYALVFFSLGMVFALLSIFFEINFLGSRTAHMYGHLSALRTVRATLDDHHTERSEKLLGEQFSALKARAEHGDASRITLDDTKDGLPNDFVYSPLALFTLNLSGGAWIGGLSMILLSLLA